MRHGFIKVACASPEVVVANCTANASSIKATIDICSKQGIKLLCLPELCVTGATCGDLFAQKTLLDSAQNAISDITNHTANVDTVVIIGAPIALSGRIYNCAVVIYDGEILGIVPKAFLSVDEQGVFSHPDTEISEVSIGRHIAPFGTHLIFRNINLPEFSFGVEIGDMLTSPISPSCELAEMGANVIVNPRAVGETVVSAETAELLVKAQSTKLTCAYITANAGEGESTTDSVFSGVGLIAENGKILACSKPFENSLTVTDIDVAKLSAERSRRNITVKNNLDYDVVGFDMPLSTTELTRTFKKLPFIPMGSDQYVKDRCENILSIQAYGLKKRIKHSHASSLIIGISGGLDSCLALLVAVRAADMLGMDRSAIKAVTMPCFGTTSRTRSNAEILCNELNVDFRCIDIYNSVKQHFLDIGHDFEKRDVVFENAQARQRTLVLMDIANAENGLVIGTGDLSELALGWATYNGDHMSMYGVNADVPKTLVRQLVRYAADTSDNKSLTAVLYDILDTPVSPELLPSAPDGAIGQKTEDLVGPYELHDFFLYWFVRYGFEPEKIFRMASATFKDDYSKDTILKWLRIFIRRFFSQQFKRSCLPDGPSVGSVSLSPRAGYKMPSDASSEAWLAALEELI